MKQMRYFLLLILTVIIISSCATAEVRAIRKGDIQQLEKFLSKGGDPDTVFSDGNPLIHIAVQNGQFASLERLLSAGANPNLLNSAGNTAAILAAGMNRSDLLNLLKEYKADMKIAGNQGKTTLMLAAANGNIQMMEKLLYAFVPINGEDRSGATALFYSISSANTEAMSFLLSSGADARHTDNNDRTPLHLLTQNKQTAYARLLVDAGTDLSRQQSTTGELPLHIASGSGAWELVEFYLGKGADQAINLSSTILGTPLFYSLKPSVSSPAAVKTMRLLLSAGADPDIPSVKEIRPVVFAVENLDIPRIELLINGRADLDIRLSEKRTLLHLAVSRDIPELAAMLIDAGINPDQKDLQGNTALLYTAEKALMNTAEILLVKGADPNITNNKRETALLITMEKDARQRQDLSDITRLLLRYGAKLPSGSVILDQLLLLSVEKGNAELAAMLLESGANPNETTHNEMTMLMVASRGKFTELSEVLLKRGARVNMRDNEGNTAMHFSSAAGSVEGVELLLHYGENPDPVNYEKIRPIQLAPENERGLQIIEILLKAGAQPLPEEVLPESENPAVDENESEADDEENVSDDIVIEDETTPPTIDEETEVENLVGEESWRKAKVLVLGEKEPRGVSEIRINFPGFSALVPQSYPQNLASKSNPREVMVFIQNNTAASAEIYQVNSERNIEEISILLAGEIFEIKTRQGNVFPIYTEDSLYFGEIKTTGQDKQYFKLIRD